MTKTYIDNMVKISADVGMDLVRESDNYRAKEVYCPIAEELNWTETNEIITGNTDD